MSLMKVKNINLVNDFKGISNFLEKNSQQWIAVSSPHSKNIVLMTESKARDLKKARRYLEYLQKLDLSEEQARRGKVVSYTIEEMRAMELIETKAPLRCRLGNIG